MSELKHTKDLISELEGKLKDGTLRSDDYLVKTISEHAVILFHAEIESELKKIIFNHSILSIISDAIKKDLTYKFGRDLGYSELKRNFEDSFWKRIETELRKEVGKHKKDFDHLIQNYSNIMVAINGISHTGHTDKTITLNTVKDAILFGETLLSLISEGSSGYSN